MSGIFHCGISWRSLLIFLLVIATIFVFVCGWGGFGGGCNIGC